MKKSLAKLPPDKQWELGLVVDIIRKNCKGVHMIILFGSYTRGKAVEHIRTKGHMTIEYKSDFDILVITGTRKQAKDVGMRSKVEGSIFNNKNINTVVTPIFHHITYVNNRLSEGQYFFSDIKQSGIMLYNSGKYKLAEKKGLEPAEKKRTAKKDFNYWFKKAERFYANYRFNLENKWYEECAFMLHQATEFCYAAVQLVFTGYKHPTHNLEKLGRMVAKHDPRLYSVFPRATKAEKKRFELLKQAYVDARYEPKYKIIVEQVVEIGHCIEKLLQLTKEICTEKIESFD